MPGDAFVPDDQCLSLASLLLVVAVDGAFVALFAFVVFVRRETQRALVRLAAIPAEYRANLRVLLPPQDAEALVAAARHFETDPPTV